MKLFFENKIGSSLEIEVDCRDTVLEVKQKIEKSHRIPVSKQDLFFNRMVLQDHLDIEQCQIVQDSRLQLFVSADHNLNHIQAEHSPPPSNSTEQIIDGHDQDSTMMVQTDQDSTENVINPHQDSTVPPQVPRHEKSPPSNSTEQIIDAHDQDSTVTVQAEQSSSSNSVEEMITTNIQDSSVKERTRKKRMVVYVLPFGESKAAKDTPVAVNVKMNDCIKELRNELVKIEERSDIKLPGLVLITTIQLRSFPNILLVALLTLSLKSQFIG